MYPCIHDHTTLSGLAALRRARPHGWHHAMCASAASARPMDSVAHALRRGGSAACLPRDASPASAARLKKARFCARRLVACYGDVVLAEIDDRWLWRERRRQAIEGHLSRSPDLIGACFTLLRQLAASARGAVPGLRARLPPKVRPPLPRPKMPSAARRASLGAVDSTLHALLPGLPRWLSAALMVQRFVGMRPGRVLALSVDDVDEANHVVRFPARTGGPALSFVLPPGAWGWLRARLQEVAHRGPTALLFPQRGRARTPRRSISRALTRFCERRGVSRLTMAAVRRRAQADLRAAGACRAQVRGRGGRRLQVGQLAAALERVRFSWTNPVGDRTRPVSRRAPRRCPPGWPELAWQRRATPFGRKGDKRPAAVALIATPATDVVFGENSPPAVEDTGVDRPPAAFSMDHGLPPFLGVPPYAPQMAQKMPPAAPFRSPPPAPPSPAPNTLEAVGVGVQLGIASTLAYWATRRGLP